tara:strand:+ start:24726 stop:24917 length:192 start_codon:yes stop_codon:yes gene_type:complete
MQDQNSTNQEELISELDREREWLLKNIDSGKWPKLRSQIAALERELSRFILRARENNSENKTN